MSRLSVLTKRQHEPDGDSAPWQADHRLAPLPRPISPWQVHPSPETVKRLLLARMLMMQNVQGRPLRRNPATPPIATTDDESSPVDGRNPAASPVEESVQQQLVSHSRHLDRAQLAQDHHDFSHRMRSR